MDDQTKQTEPKPRAVVPREPLIAQGNSPMAIVPTNFDQVWRLAQLAANAGTVNTADVGAMIILHGLEVGMPPMMALERIAIINGRKCIWGDAVPALPIARGLVEDWHEEITGAGDEMVATCSVKRKGQKSWVIRTFSVTDAKEAGLWQTEAVVKRRGRDGSWYETKNDSPWYRYRKRMLVMRARVAFRDAFPDVYSGLYLAEEMQGEHPMRDVTPRETFKGNGNPLADLPEGRIEAKEECETGVALTQEIGEAIAEDDRRSESLPPFNEAGPSMRWVAGPEQPFDPETGEIIEGGATLAKAHLKPEGAPCGLDATDKDVAFQQQPPEARRKPAGEPEPQGAIQVATAVKNEPATSLRDLVDKANIKAPETFPLEVVEHAPLKQAKATEPAPAADGNGFLPEALAIVANAVDASKLNRWWRESRNQRKEANLTATQLDQLTQAYNQKFIRLSEA